MIGIVLLGQSNSGKSTIGKVVAQRTGIKYVSSGDIARKMSVDVQRDLNAGKLAPEDRMRKEIRWELTHNNALILDGFPRFLDQYIWMKQFNARFIYVIIEAPYEDILARAMGRRRCDDQSISNKMQWYEENTKPMIKHIIKAGERVYCISNGNSDDIYKNTETA